MATDTASSQDVKSTETTTQAPTQEVVKTSPAPSTDVKTPPASDIPMTKVSEFSVPTTIYQEIKLNAMAEANRKMEKELKETGKLLTPEKAQQITDYEELLGTFGKHIDPDKEMTKEAVFDFMDSYTSEKTKGISLKLEAELKKNTELAKLNSEQGNAFKQYRIQETLESVVLSDDNVDKSSAKDMVKLMLLEDRVRIADDSNEPYVVDEAGKIMYAAETGTPVTVKEYYASWISKRPHFTKAIQNSGAGGDYAAGQGETGNSFLDMMNRRQIGGIKVNPQFVQQKR